MTGDALQMTNAAVRAVEPGRAVKQHFTVDDNKQELRVGPDRCYDLTNYDNVVIAALGKAAAPMACAVVEQLLTQQQQEDVSSNNAAPHHPTIHGLVLTKDGHVTPAQRRFLTENNVTVREAAHPVPDERGVAASHELMELVSGSSHHGNTLVVACISGGGSALFCTPAPGLTLLDLQAAHTALLQTGWDVRAMNRVRQRLETGKGGGLARAAALAGSNNNSSTTDMVALLLSDVLGDPLDLIASGPTVVSDTDATSSSWSWERFRQRWPSDLELPPAVWRVLQQEDDPPSQTKKSRTINDGDNDRSCGYCYNYLVGNNAMAVWAAAAEARRLGYSPVVLGTQWQGEAQTVAQVLVAMAQHLRQPPSCMVDDDDGDDSTSLLGNHHKFPVALIAGGETTVTLPALSTTGKGGRNQELALAAALALQSHQLRQVVVASVGTDGSDGPTDAAGGIVDGGTVDRLAAIVDESAEQALQRHNAYPYLAHQDAAGVSPLVKVRTKRIGKEERNAIF